MLISESWLREWVALDITTQQLAENLTQAGLEVETIEPVRPLGDLVRVGEVVEIKPHPDADKLKVCEVNIGLSDNLTIVCGAPNAALGIKAPVALEGATLPNGVKIEQRAVRGVRSCGMLCSSAELGLDDEASGLLLLTADAVVGALIDDHLLLDDNCIDVDLTPDRGDCLSIAGVAREMGVIAKAEYTPLAFGDVEPSHNAIRTLHLAAAKACPRYVGRVIKNINAGAQSPDWLKERLRRVGLRSIDPVVDVTNYVMIELGQPMHAFDHAKISGDITIRFAKSDEKLILLDGQLVDLSDDMLLITDQSGPIALAGIMGGLGTAIDSQTTDIFLESAFFAADAIVGRARSLGLHTDASHRFERGVDHQIARPACRRASELLQQIVGGEYGEIIDTIDEAVMPSIEEIYLRPERITRLLGLEVAGDEVEDNLTRLGMKLITNGNGWTVSSPSWRFDISGEHDLIEEVGRTVGLDKIQPKMPKLHTVPQNSKEASVSSLALKMHLAAENYREVVSYSFVDPSDQQALFPQMPAVMLANPIADNMSQMRVSIWAGLLRTAKINQQRQHNRHRYFELGKVFSPDAERETGVNEVQKLAVLLSGAKSPIHWSSEDQLSDYFDLKGILDKLFARLKGNATIRYEQTSNTALHPGQCAQILFNESPIGLIGALHPSLQNRFELKQTTYLTEIDLDAITEQTIPSYVDVSRFPESKRDIAIVVNLEVPAQSILEEITEKGGKLLKSCTIFDTYTGNTVQLGQKSLAVALTFQSINDSVSSEQVESTIQEILSGLSDKFDAQLRT